VTEKFWWFRLHKITQYVRAILAERGQVAMSENLPKHKPRIAIFDYSVRSDSAMGGCHLRMLEGLCDLYDFTVFALDFENPRPDRIDFVRIPAPKRPTILLSIVYHLVAPILYLTYRIKHRVRFDLVERMEVYTFLGRVSYVHFCYRTYLKRHWIKSRQPGVRGLLLSLDHASRAFVLEPLLYRFARKLIVPSQGLARELEESYPFAKSKIHLLPNSANFWHLSQPPASFDRDRLRQQYGFGAEDVVLVFIALGQFERKGLPQLLEAIKLPGKTHIKLLIVGGSSHWIHEYGRMSEQLGIGAQVAFAGMQRDVAPFLWAADIFSFPSLYETFCLVALESAAAGCAILITRLNGVEDYIRDGESGIFIERTPDSIARGIAELDAMGPTGRKRLGDAAQQAAREYTVEVFVKKWDILLQRELSIRGASFNRDSERVERSSA
jgi:glycosyltransferase involved in cell wall biosynthesis